MASLYVNATQIRNKWDCRKSSAQSERRDICGAFAIRSGSRMVGGFHGVLLLSALSDGKTPYERRFGMPFNGPVIPFWNNGRISPCFCERDQSGLHQFGAKVLPSIFLGCALHAGVNLERRHYGRRH